MILYQCWMEVLYHQCVYTATETNSQVIGATSPQTELDNLMLRTEYAMSFKNHYRLLKRPQSDSIQLPSYDTGDI